MSDYFPSGRLQMPKGDDNLSDHFNLSQTIYYFGEPVTYVHVSINGYIAMGNNFSSYTPDPLTKHALVAPFFTDVDTRAAGNVYYGEEHRSDLLEKAAKEVQNTKRSSPDFKPTILFIATWDGVGYFNSKSDKVNTFQAVIASNGFETHVLMYYKSINWTSPDNMNGQNGRLKGSDKTRLPILGVGDGKGREHRVCGQKDEATILGLPYTKPKGSDKYGQWIFVVSEPGTTMPRVGPAGDEDGEADSLLTTHKDFPETLLFGEMLGMSFGEEGGTLGNLDDSHGFMIEVPRGAVPDVLTIESRVGFGGPFLLDEYIEAIGPPYFFTEKTPPQRFKKDVTFAMKHSAHLPAPEDRDSVFFVCFSPNLTNGVYMSRVVSSNEARFQITDQFGKLMLRELNNCHVMLVKRIKKDPQLSPEDASKEEMRSVLKFMVTFYKSRVQRETRLVPFTSISVYADHPVDRKIAEKEILKYWKAKGSRVRERDGEWCENENCAFDLKSTAIVIVPSMHTGWQIEQSHDLKISWDDLWAERKKRLGSNLKGLEQVKCPKSLGMKFHKLQDSRVYYRQCTVSAHGFTKKVLTNVYLHWDQVHAATEKAFENVLREIMMQLSNEFQASNFTEFLGVDHSTVEKMRMEYNRPSASENGYDVMEMNRDQLANFILQLYSYIERNSRRLQCDEEKVYEALAQVRHGDTDLAEEFSRKLRIHDAGVESIVESNSRSALALSMPPISRRTRSRAAHPSLAEEDAVNNSCRKTKGPTKRHRRSLSG